MTFDDVRDLLASRGLTGEDAASAFRAWASNPRSADGRRVQRILEVGGFHDLD
jgi:hypothetical protein